MGFEDQEDMTVDNAMMCLQVLLTRVELVH